MGSYRGGGLNYLNFATEQFAHYRHSSAKKRQSVMMMFFVFMKIQIIRYGWGQVMD